MRQPSRPHLLRRAAQTGTHLQHQRAPRVLQLDSAVAELFLPLAQHQAGCDRERRVSVSGVLA